MVCQEHLPKKGGSDMAERKKPGKKDIDGKIKSQPFQVIERCQAFSAKVFIASAGAPKEYRFTICKIIQTYSCELVHTARLANCYKLESPERLNTHNEVLELMEKISDLLPVLRRCRCISLGQESELFKDLSNLQYGYKAWMESDKRRIAFLNK